MSGSSSSSFLTKLGLKLRQLFTVNYRHIDAHDVFVSGAYRKATTVPYKPPQTSFDKLANNQYYKRDVRRSYPVTQVHTANSVKEVKLVTADGASASSTALPPTPGTPVYLNYSRNPSEYPTINNYN